MVAGQRFPGLDAWRAGLMLLGLLVHANYLQESRPLFDVVGFVSAHFRMGVFMIISGLLAGTASATRSTGDWLKRRALGITVPLLMGLAVTGPTIALLGRAYGLNNHDMPSPITFHHMWFLLALLIYLPLVPLLEAVDRRFVVTQYLERSELSVVRLQLLLLGLTGTASAMLMGGVTFASRRWGPWPVGVADLVNNIPDYAPMFLLGVLLGRAPTLRAALLSDIRLPAVALAATVFVELTLFATGALSGSETGAMFTLVLGLSICPVLVAVLVLRAATKVRTVGPLVLRLSDAAMTMYIVHFPILAVLNVALGRVSWNIHAEYGLAVVVAGGLSYGFHRHAVRRSRTLSTLFNGRFSHRRTGRDTPPAPSVACLEVRSAF